MCKNEKKFIKLLTERKIYFDIFYKGTLSILTIMLTVQFNKYINNQTEIMDREVAPSFSFSKIADDTYNDVYKMINIKGFISNISFEKIDVIHTNYNGISFYNYFFRENLNRGFDPLDNKTWLFIPSDQNFDGNKIANFIDDYGKKKGLDTMSSYCVSYYHVVYNNYQNQRYDEYYKINSDDSSAIYALDYKIPDELSEEPNLYRKYSLMTHHMGPNNTEYDYAKDSEMWEIMIQQIKSLQNNKNIQGN